MSFGADYPMAAPECVWVPPAPVHSHIYSNGHICLDILYEGGRGTWSPALTVASVARSLQSMLLQATARDRSLPPGDADYVARTGGRSSRETVRGEGGAAPGAGFGSPCCSLRVAQDWLFHDDKV